MNPEEIDKMNPPAADAALAEPPPLYAQRTRLVAFAMNAYHLRHLGRCYQMFDGDLAQAIVLGEIGLHHHSGEIGTDMSPTAQQLFNVLLREHILTVTPGPISASAFSRSTGIPRETVRRKIASLLQRGWLAATASGGFRVTDCARDYFGYPFALDALNDFLATDERLRQLLELAPDARPPWTALPTHEAGNRQNPDWSTRVLFSRWMPPLFPDESRWSTSYLHLLVSLIHSHNLRHLKQVNAMLDGDLLLAVVLGEIAHANVMAVLMQPDQSLNGFEALFATTESDPYDHGRCMTECNAFSLSAATGIPRETIRRKIARLMRLGWIVKKPRGGYIVTSV